MEYSFPLSLLLLTTDDVIKCPKLYSKTTRSTRSTCSFEHFMTSSVINKSTDKGKLYTKC